MGKIRRSEWVGLALATGALVFSVAAYWFELRRVPDAPSGTFLTKFVDISKAGSVHEFDIRANVRWCALSVRSPAVEAAAPFNGRTKKWPAGSDFELKLWAFNDAGRILSDSIVLSQTNLWGALVIDTSDSQEFYMHRLKAEVLRAPADPRYSILELSASAGGKLSASAYAHARRLMILPLVSVFSAVAFIAAVSWILAVAARVPSSSDRKES
jgi:hypothetical protein